ncbi:MAG: hypothetical protein ABI091_13655 [Ferruginibacter sp.]
MENKKVEVTKVEVTKIAFRNKSIADTPFIKDFLKSINNKLRCEFENTMNAYRGSEKYLFDYGERTLLGLYTNAIIRGDNGYDRTILQEYRVDRWRCDLLLSLNNKNTDIIFEVKKCCYNGKQYDDEQQEITKGYIDKCFDQGEDYFKKEEEWFDNDTYIIVLIFDSIDIFKNLKMQKELRKYKPNKYPKDGIDFYSFFYIKGISGLGVYGSIKKVKIKNT